MNYLNKFLFYPSLLLLLMACDPLDEVGPGLCPSDSFIFTEGDLKIDVLSKVGGNEVRTPLVNANYIIDLNGEGLHIHAKLNETVKWELEIKLKDGSISKLYKAESDTISIYWYGNGDKKALFNAGNAEITFTIICVDDIKKSVTLLNTPTFKNLHHGYGILVRDWDNNGTFPVQTLGVPNFVYGSSDGFAWIDTSTFVIKYEDTDPSPMGGYSLNVYNKLSSKPVWYHGATGVNSSNFDDEIDMLPTADAEELYLNFYAKGDQSLKNTSLELTYDGLGVYGWATHLNWDGWKLISIKFSEFKQGTSPMQSVAKGNYLSFNLGSQPLESSEAQFNVDFVLITVGAPLFGE